MKVFDVIERVALVVSGMLLVATAALMNVEIATRYLFGGSTQISEEYSEYFLAAMSALCFIPALRQGRFLQVQSLLLVLPLKVQAVLEFLAGLLGAFLCAVLAYGTWVLAMNSYRFGSVSVQYSQTPLVIPQSLVPLCLSILCLTFIEQGTRRALSLWHGRAIKRDDYVVD